MPRPRQSDSPLTQPLSGKRLRREVKAAGRLAVGPEKKIVKAERRTSKVQSRRIRDWFPEYDQAIKQASQRTTSAYAQADQRMANASQTAAEYANSLRQELASEGQQDAANRGVAYDPSGSQTNVAAQLARINSTDTLRGVTAAQGASQSAYYDDKRRIGQREEIEQLLREQARRRSYGQDLKDLAKRQSDAQIAEKGRLRDSERDYYLGLLAARSTKQQNKISEANSIRSAATQRRGQDITAKNSKRSARTSRQNSKRAHSGSSGGGDKGGEGVRAAMAEARQQAGTKGGKFKSAQDLRDFLITQGYSKKVVAEAVKKFQRQGFKPAYPGDKPGGWGN